MQNATLPRLTNAERQILEQLQTQELFGLQLSETGTVKRGTVYVTLARMEKKGYVASRQEPLSDRAIGLPRRWYRMTTFGGRVLDAWRAAETVFDQSARAGAA
ncbi:MAG TPA: PadR family transcriptional regulator [Vicinamibacterales bacterium]|nr:PadR family transcriptional regulator [Vicinamibacterales bacterium]